MILIMKHVFHGNMLVQEVIFKFKIFFELNLINHISDVVGTPTFFINGVMVSADPSWTLSNWKSVIDPILASNEKSSSIITDCPAWSKRMSISSRKNSMLFSW